MNKRNITFTLIIYAIILGVYNMLVFVIFKDRTSVFWISYFFASIAIVVQFFSAYYAFKGGDSEAIFFGIPLGAFSVYYLCVSVTVATLFMIFQFAGTTLAIVLQLLILAIFVIISIVSVMAKEVSLDINKDIKQKIVTLKSVVVDIEMVWHECQDQNLKEQLRKLIETVKYSDPMTNPIVANIESRIFDKVYDLRLNFDENKLEEVMKNCTELERLYSERNKKLLITK